jgi:hypothetical protein
MPRKVIEFVRLERIAPKVLEESTELSLDLRISGDDSVEFSMHSHVSSKSRSLSVILDDIFQARAGHSRFHPG